MLNYALLHTPWKKHLNNQCQTVTPPTLPLSLCSLGDPSICLSYGHVICLAQKVTAGGASSSAHYTTRHPACSSLSCIFMRRFCSESAGYWCLSEEVEAFFARWRKRALISLLTRLRPVFHPLLAHPASRCRGCSRVTNGNQRERGSVCLPEGERK